MQVGARVMVRVNAEREEPATVIARQPDREGRYDYVAVQFGDGRFVVMPDNPHTAEVIRLIGAK